MVSVGVEMASLSCDLHDILVGNLVGLSHLLLCNLELSVVESGVGEGITEEGNSAADISLEACHVQVSNLTIDIRADATTHTLDLFGKSGLGCGGCASEKHRGEHVGNSCGLKGVLAGAGLDVNTNAIVEEWSNG